MDGHYLAQLLYGKVFLDMQIRKTNFADVLIVQSQIFSDERGYFYENFNQKRFAELSGVNAHFVQDNQSQSVQGTLRGLHYQIKQPQGKLARVVEGEVFDVVVDIRKQSPTFGKWFGTVLSAENKLQLWIPPGFAHGFFVTSKTAVFLYKTTDYWAAEHERCILWNDPAIGINWPQGPAPLLSDKDRSGKLLADADVYV